MSEYYRAYEERYRAVRDVGEFTWGHTRDDERFTGAIGDWVRENELSGKRVAEFACGEGAAAVLLCGMGCIYEGYDIAPTAVEICQRALAGFENARVAQLDMVRQPLTENAYDGVLDVSGLHMLVTDADRAAYIGNVFRMLKRGATALFWQESYREDAFEGNIDSIDQWKEYTGLDFDTPQKRTIGNTGHEVMLKLLPARPRSREGYISEFERAGFAVEWFREIKNSDFMTMSAGILVRKPVL